MTVSVIIPTYKDHKGLNRALKSAVNQTYDKLEIIVVNDFPEEKIDKYIQVEDERIKTIDLDENIGGAGERARNVGIEKSNGEFIFCLDGDDEIVEDAIEKMIKKYKNSEFKAITCWGKELSGDLMKIPKEEGNLYQRSLEVCIFIPPSPLIKKKDLLKVGKYDENLRIGDRELGMRIAEKLQIGVVKEPLYIYDAKETEGMKKIRVKRLESQEYLLDKHQNIRKNSRAYSNITQRMGLGYMLANKIKKSRYYFKESLDNSFSIGTLVTYLTTFSPKFFRDLIFRTIERNKHLLKELGY